MWKIIFMLSKESLNFKSGNLQIWQKIVAWSVLNYSWKKRALGMDKLKNCVFKWEGWRMKDETGQKSSSLEYFWRPPYVLQTFRHGRLVGNPHIFIEDPQISLWAKKYIHKKNSIGHPSDWKRVNSGVERTELQLEKSK